MRCIHSIEPKTLAKNYYLSLKFTEAWKQIISQEKYPKNFLLCLQCCESVGSSSDIPKHKKETGHTLFFDLISLSIYCSKCQKHLKCPQPLRDIPLLSIPILPVPLCKGGFPNLGSSCYSSAVLAALSSCQPLVIAALCSQIPLCRVFAASAVENRNFNHIIHSMLPQFMLNKQHDAAEFLLYLIDKLCDDPLIRSLFGGSTTTIFSCSNCKTKTISDQPFTVLPVPLNNNGWSNPNLDPHDSTKPRSFGSNELWHEEHEATAASSFVSFMMHGSTDTISLQKCMESMFSPSITNCEKCNNEKCEISVSLTSLPEILILHLVRFTKRWFGQGKVFQFISFPGQGDIDFGHFVPSEVNCGPTIYQLSAIVSHSGTMNKGHYVCFAKINNVWYLFDDTDVAIVDEESALKSQAYILFYVRKRNDEISKLIKTINERGLPFDFATPLRVISDPQKWIGTVPDIGVGNDILDQASAIAGGDVRREETIDDLRTRFITRMPLSETNTKVKLSDFDATWSFLFEKGPVPDIELGKGDIPVSTTIELFKSYIERHPLSL